MNDNNGKSGMDDLSFGFSGTDGWLGGTDGSFGQYNGFEDNGAAGYNSGNDVFNGMSGGDMAEDLNAGYDDNAQDTYSAQIAKSEEPVYDSYADTVYDRPAEPDEYSDAYQKALSKVSRHKEDQKSIWQFGFGESNKADFGMPDWPARHHIEKYKYGDIAVKRSKMNSGRSHIAAKIMLVAWLVIGIAASVFFFTKHEFWTIIWYIIQAIAGLGTYFAIKPVNRLKGFPIFLVIDALLTGGVIALRFAKPEGIKNLTETMGLVLGLLVFSIVGIITLLYGGIKFFRSMSRCSHTVEAMCLNAVKVHSRKSSTVTYCPIYEFFYNGRKYIVRPDVFTSSVPPKLGKMYKLRINPLYPTDYYDLVRDGMTDIVVIIFGAIWTAFCSGFVIMNIVRAFM